MQIYLNNDTQTAIFSTVSETEFPLLDELINK